MFILFKTQEFVDVRVGESTQPDHGYELSDKCIITKSSNAVAGGAGSKGLFSYKSTKLKSAECKINQSLRDVDNGAGSKGLFSVNVD